MKLIIAGGRDYVFTRGDAKRIDAISPSEIISGGATGADAGGEKYARARNLPLTIIRAEWDKYDRAAGPKRNEEMAQIADGVALFKGGKGTASMHRYAKKYNLEIFDFR